MPSKTELFLDDEGIEMTVGASRHTHSPTKHRPNPVLRPGESSVGYAEEAPGHAKTSPVAGSALACVTGWAHSPGAVLDQHHRRNALPGRPQGRPLIASSALSTAAAPVPPSQGC